MNTQLLSATINDMVIKGKGILAADESVPTMTKRLQSIQVESTEENRRIYRQLLITTESLNEYVSGVILFEETLKQSNDNGKLLSEVLREQGIVPGIKVDKGLIPLVNANAEKVTQGLDGLPDRLEQYKEFGARFAKWRAVYSISDNTPSRQLIETNAENLARYAAICQAHDIVPIVEPEVLLDGAHDIQRCAEVTECVQNEVFAALRRHKVVLEYIILKPSMVLSGKDNANRASIEEVAGETLRILRRTVPAAVPSINFLSGGQTPEEATAHLQEMNKLAAHAPWQLSFSYGRALQEPALSSWAGRADNISTAQQALLKRAKLNGAASQGQYAGEE